jgi:hypothetical protein
MLGLGFDGHTLRCRVCLSLSLLFVNYIITSVVDYYLWCVLVAARPSYVHWCVHVDCVNLLVCVFIFWYNFHFFVRAVIRIVQLCVVSTFKDGRNFQGCYFWKSTTIIGMLFAPNSSFGRAVLGDDNTGNKLFLTYLFIHRDVGIQFLKETGLIPTQMMCNTCGRDMTWCVRPQSDVGFVYACRKHAAIVCNQFKSVKHRSFFQHYKTHFPGGFVPNLRHRAACTCNMYQTTASLQLPPPCAASHRTQVMFLLVPLRMLSANWLVRSNNGTHVSYAQ